MLKIFLISYKTSAAYTCENLQSHATNCFGEITVLINSRNGPRYGLRKNILCQNFPSTVYIPDPIVSISYISIDLRWS